MKDKRILVPILIVVLTNIYVLVGITSNRSDPPEASLELTERELSISRYDDENSGLFLKMEWDNPVFRVYGARSENLGILDQRKLNELGWECPMELPDTQHSCYKNRSHIKAYILMEYGGDSLQQWLESHKQELENKRKELDEIKDEKKRVYMEREVQRIAGIPLQKGHLFAVDFSTDPETLRTRYPDRSRYIIVPGLVRIYYAFRKKNPTDTRSVILRLQAHLDEILVGKIYVPDEFREFFKTKIHPNASKPRYKARVNFGKRYEPWIESVTLYQ